MENFKTIVWTDAREVLGNVLAEVISQVAGDALERKDFALFESNDPLSDTLATMAVKNIKEELWDIMADSRFFGELTESLTKKILESKKKQEQAEDESYREEVMIAMAEEARGR